MVRTARCAKCGEEFALDELSADRLCVDCYDALLDENDKWGRRYDLELGEDLGNENETT